MSALAFTGRDVEAAIREAERRYRAKGAPCWFTVTEVSEPGDLDGRLAALGYQRSHDHVTMAKEVAAGAAAADADIELSDSPTPEWMAVYLTGLSADRRAVAPTILAGLPAPRTFIACRRGGAVVGSGLTVPDGELASVQCMATLAGRAAHGLCAPRARAPSRPRLPARGCRLLYLQAECRQHSPQSRSTRALAFASPADTICAGSAEPRALEAHPCPRPPIPTCSRSTGRRSRRPSTTALRGICRARALPDIALPATDGTQVSLAKIAGRVVVFAYPRTGEPGKPSLVDDWDMIPGAGAARRRPAPSATCTRC